MGESSFCPHQSRPDTPAALLLVSTLQSVLWFGDGLEGPPSSRGALHARLEYVAACITCSLKYTLIKTGDRPRYKFGTNRGVLLASLVARGVVGGAGETSQVNISSHKAGPRLWPGSAGSSTVTPLQCRPPADEQMMAKLRKKSVAFHRAKKNSGRFAPRNK